MIGAYAAPGEAELEACALTDSAPARLACYDAAMGRSNSNPTAARGEWSVSDETNPLDDTRTVTLVLAASDGESSFGRPIALVIRCKSNETDLYINWGNYLGSEASVTTRIGQSQATTRNWQLSTDSVASFHPSPIPFARQMLEADRLVAQVTPYSESPKTAIFNLSGMSESIAPLRETCGW